MNLSSKYKFAFLCMPKCASTSIERAIAKYSDITFKGDSGQKHMRAHQFRTEVDGFIETFCIMRDPIDWLGSWYRYRSRPALEGTPNYTGTMTFDHFIEGYLSRNKPPYATFIDKQSDFFTMPSHTCGVDVIFDMKRLDLVEKYLSTKIGTDIVLPYTNSSPKKEQKDLVISGSVRAKLNKKIEKDVLIYNTIAATGVATAHQINELL